MENIENLNVVENTSTPNAPEIATTDENLSVDAMFQQGALPSLGKQIFSVVPMHGPTAALFNIRPKADKSGFELLRNDVEVYPTTSINTRITQEAIQDLKAQYGKEANLIVGRLLRGLSNEQENDKTLAFLDANALAVADLQLTDSLNSEVNLFEISQKVQELILKMNNKNLRTYEAFAVIPATALGGIMALHAYAGGKHVEERGLFIAHIGQTKFYLNPDATSTKAYVGLKDSENPSKSSAVFSPYKSEIVEALDAETGENTYHIFNRFAITASPLHETDNEMLYTFNVLL